MNTHATGPWHLLPRGRVNRSGQPTFDVMAGPGSPENWDMVADRVDGEANARLIAAAPEMFDLLKRAVARVRDQNDMGDMILRAWRDEAIATIAKAEGGKGE